MGLARDNGVVTTMGLVDSVAHSWGITMLDDLVTGLVSQSGGQKAKGCNKNLRILLLLSSFVYLYQMSQLLSVIIVILCYFLPCLN